MELRDLKEHLVTLGANLARWPKADAEAAIELLAISTAAQDLFAKFSEEDQALFGRGKPDLTDLADSIADKIPDEN
jgi:hypothetical protein